MRNVMGPYDKATLTDYLDNALNQAGADHLMSVALKETLVEHVSGNLRVLNNMAAELLIKAAHEELPQLDEKLLTESNLRTPYHSSLTKKHPFIQYIKYRDNSCIKNTKKKSGPHRLS